MKKKIWALALTFVLAASQFAFAASVITKDYEFTTTNPDYTKYTVDNIGKGELKDIPTTVKNGFFTVKRVTDIEISLLSEERPEVKTYTNLTEKEVPSDKKEITVGGKTLKLLKTEWDEETTDRTAATGSITKYGYNKQPSFPDTKTLSYTANGKVYTTTGYLTSVKQTGQSYSEDFSVTGKFVGDEDVEYYDLDGARIENNPSSPAFAGYESTILKYFGLDASTYKLTGAKWTSDYKTEDGETVRYAKFYGKKLSNNWTAYYQEDFTKNSPDVITSSTVYEATCYYGEQEDSIYNVKVTVEYGKTEIIVGRVVAVSAGVLVLAGLLTFFLMALAKKKKKENDTEE